MIDMDKDRAKEAAKELRAAGCISAMVDAKSNGILLSVDDALRLAALLKSMGGH